MSLDQLMFEIIERVLEAGWKTMLATGVADQDKSFAK